MKNRLLIIIVSIQISLVANNSFSENFYKFDSTFKSISKKYNVPFALLKAIALTENYKFSNKEKMNNKNKTVDYGLMQINSLWLKKLNIKKRDIVKPAVNIGVAALIINDLISKYGYSWDTIGKYHSYTPKHKKKWLKKIKQNMRYLIDNDNRYNYVLK